MKRRNVERRQCRIRMMPSDYRCRVWRLLLLLLSPFFAIVFNVSVSGTMGLDKIRG